MQTIDTTKGEIIKGSNIYPYEVVNERCGLNCLSHQF